MCYCLYFKYYRVIFICFIIFEGDDIFKLFGIRCGIYFWGVFVGGSYSLNRVWRRVFY